MNTKDTIEVLEYHFNTKEGLYKSVVKLLKRGERYEQMWKKLEYENYLIAEFDNDGYLLEKHSPHEFRQKYFPKED